MASLKQFAGVVLAVAAALVALKLLGRIFPQAKQIPVVGEIL